MSGSATTLSLRASRWILIAAAFLALLGSVAAPAQAGEYYGRYGNGYGYGSSGYGGYYRHGYNNGCSSCGCHRCGCGGCRPHVRRGGVYERRYVEREYVERRYVAPIRRHYGCCNGYSGSYYPGYRSTPFPYGYGGVRGARPYGYGPAAYYDGAPRPPAPVGYDAEPYGDAGEGWNPE